ncbi:hypothetical protein JHK86_009870 [Glycine max]|nr:hypothetical protein JHK86_009870 [Glycine max]
MCSLLPVVNGSLEFYVSFPRTAIEGAAELCVRFPCFVVEGYPNIPWQRSGLKQRALSTIETEDERKTRLVELRGQIRNERSALRPTTSITSTRVRVSLVNGDGDNDVTEVYPNDDDNQHDVGFEDGDEVEIMMISGFQFDMEEITDEVVSRLDFGDLELAYQFYCWKMSASDIMQVENYRKVGIRPPHMYATFANQCGGYDKVGFIRKDIYNEEGRMRKQHTSDAIGALKYLHYLRKKDPMMTIKLRVIDCKEMITLLIYTVLKYCSGSVWLVSYCPSTVDFSCSCMRMQSIGLPCDHILVVLDSLNFMELPSSLVLNRWSKVATENIKDKYLDSAMYWDSQLMAKYATLVEVSRQVCKAAYRDEDEYDKMLHFLSNEVRRLKSKKNSEPCIDDNDEQADQQGDNYDGILDPVVVRIKGCRQVGVDEYGKQRRIQKCGQCGGSGHNKRSCRNRLRNANVCVDGLFISSSEQTNTMCQPTDEYNYELLMQQPHTFVAGSSRPGP